MKSAQGTVQIIEKGGVVPVVRLPDLAGAVGLAQALLDGGVTAVELTMTSPGALEALSLLRERVPAFADGEAALGMGSVLNADMAAAAIENGAQFVVAPTLDLPTVSYCVEQKVPVMPGAFTPTEIQTAWLAGRGGGEGLSGNQAGAELLQRCTGAAAPSETDAHGRGRPGECR